MHARRKVIYTNRQSYNPPPNPTQWYTVNAHCKRTPGSALHSLQIWHIHRRTEPILPPKYWNPVSISEALLTGLFCVVVSGLPLPFSNDKQEHGWVNQVTKKFPSGASCPVWITNGSLAWRGWNRHQIDFYLLSLVAKEGPHTWRGGKLFAGKERLDRPQIFFCHLNLAIIQTRLVLRWKRSFCSTEKRKPRRRTVMGRRGIFASYFFYLS